MNTDSNLSKRIDDLLAKLDSTIASQKQKSQERREALAKFEEEGSATQAGLDRDIEALVSTLDSESVGFLTILTGESHR